MSPWLERIKSWRNDRVFGGILIILGVLFGWAIALFFIFAHEAIPLSMLVGPASLVFIGLLVFLNTGVLQALAIEQDIQKFPELIADDIEDLKAGRLTPAHGMLSITVFTLLGLIGAVILYRKWGIAWGGCLNVVVVAVLAGFLVGLVGLSTKWYRIRKQRLSWGIFLIPLVAFGLCAFLGIYFAEPRIETGRDLPVSQGTDYRYVNSATRIGDTGGQGVLSIMDGGMSFDCDDEGCLILILVVVALACIAASAFIPHFWVVATTILWVIMLLITVRELLYVVAPANEVMQAEV